MADISLIIRVLGILTAAGAVGIPVGLNHLLPKVLVEEKNPAEDNRLDVGDIKVSENLEIEEKSGSVGLNQSEYENNEENQKGQFLFEFAKKVYPYLKSKNTADVQDKYKKVDKETLIEGLRSEFGDTQPGTGDWIEFKKLCEIQVKSTTRDPDSEEDAEDVEKTPARLCFVDEKTYINSRAEIDPNGSLELGSSYDINRDRKGYQGFSYNDGGPSNGTNRFIFQNYWGQHSNDTVESKFEEGYTKAKLKTITSSGTTVEKQLSDVLKVS